MLELAGMNSGGGPARSLLFQVQKVTHLIFTVLWRRRVRHGMPPTHVIAGQKTSGQVELRGRRPTSDKVGAFNRGWTLDFKFQSCGVLFVRYSVFDKSIVFEHRLCSCSADGVDKLVALLCLQWIIPQHLRS